VRLIALSILVIGNLFANQVHAEDVSTQPLTRVDCDTAEMAWDENANVCGADWGHVWGQPLTRHECDKVGMAWDDNANVCGTASQAAEAVPTLEVADTAGQPLTREDCDKADLSWNDTANVCGSASLAAEAAPDAQGVPTVSTSEVADTASQPPTRGNCDNAGMYKNFYADSFPQRPRRGGVFRRLFGGL
jgi:hypothetical protein